MENEGGAGEHILVGDLGSSREEVGLRNVVQQQDRDSTHLTLEQQGDTATDRESVCNCEGRGAGL